MGEQEIHYGTALPIESIKVMAESIGISTLADDAAKYLADDVTYRLKIILQDAMKFMIHERRTNLLPDDIEHSMKLHYTERMCSSVSERSQFKFASGDGRELHFIEDKEIDLEDIENVTLTPPPVEPALHVHWLAIDGIEVEEHRKKIIAQNTKQNIEDETASKQNEGETAEKESTSKSTVNGKKRKLRNVETVHVKQLATHELSVEQQLYYKAITEACVGSDEQSRMDALTSLSYDPSIYEMMPYICIFIAEGVKVNTVQHNLALLIYLMRMVKSLFDNETIYIEKYLHELIPSVVTCIVSKQTCLRPDTDNHWALRDFSARLLSQICKTYSTSINKIMERVIALFERAISDTSLPLSTLYGGILGFADLDQNLLAKHVIPKIKEIAFRLGQIFESSAPNEDKIAAGQVKRLIVKLITPILKNTHQTASLDKFGAEFGYLGPVLYNALRQPTQDSTLASNSLKNSGIIGFRR